MPAKAKRTKKQPTPESVKASEHATEPAAPEGGRKIIDLPGMVGDGVAKIKIDALDNAVLDYVQQRDLRIEHGLKEKTNKKLVLALMEKHNLGTYEVDDMVVVKKPKDDTASIKVVSKADYVGDP